MILNRLKKCEVFWLLLSICITLVCLVIVFRLWNKDFSVPIAYQNDGLGAVATIKGIIEGEGFWKRSYWSAPFGETNYLVDYIFPLVIVKIISIFSSDVAIVTNVFWIFTYIFTCITTYFLFRKLKVSNAIAVAASVIYNFLPYHYFRIEHFWLAGCYIIPLAIWIILDIYYLAKDKDTGLTKKEFIIDFIFCIIIGLNGIYYAVFTAILILIIGFCNLISCKKIKSLGFGLSFVIIIFIPIVCFYIIPGAIFGGGAVLTAASETRTLTDIDLYGLRIFSLFFPIPGHRITALAEFTKQYFTTLNVTNESYTACLGLLMSIGLILSLVQAICGKAFKECADLLTLMGRMNIIIILLASVGGLANFIGIFLTSSIRCFNRMSIFIALNSLIVLSICIDAILKKMGGKWITEIIVAFLLITVGVWDQTSESFAEYSLYDPYTNEYDWTYKDKEYEYNMLNLYFDQIENIVGEDANIYQMPQIVNYDNTESPFTKMKAYICSDTLNWSYSEWYLGYNDWMRTMEQNDTEHFLKALSILDMSGILIDKNSFADINEFYDKCNEIEQLCQVAPIKDETGNLYFYDIRTFKNSFLNGIDDSDRKLLLDGIQDEIDNVSITSIPQESLSTRHNGQNNDDVLNLEKSDLQYGPYIDLQSGSYKITLLGEHLNTGKVSVTSNCGENIIDINNVVIQDTVITYEIELDELTEDVEFIYEGEENATIMGYYVEQKSVQDYHDIIEYYYILKMLKDIDYDSSHVILNAQELYINGVTITLENGKIVLKPDQLQFGPYHDLSKGKYEITIRGIGLIDSEIRVTAGNGEKEIKYNLKKRNDNIIVYDIFLQEDEENVEFLITNGGDSDIVIEDYYYDYISDEVGGVLHFIE